MKKDFEESNVPPKITRTIKIITIKVKNISVKYSDQGGREPGVAGGRMGGVTSDRIGAGILYA